MSSMVSFSKRSTGTAVTIVQKASKADSEDGSENTSEYTSGVIIRIAIHSDCFCCVAWTTFPNVHCFCNDIEQYFEFLLISLINGRSCSYKRLKEQTSTDTPGQDVKPGKYFWTSEIHSSIQNKVEESPGSASKIPKNIPGEIGFSGNFTSLWVGNP